MITSNNKTPAQSDDELKQKAFKRIIDICEDSISRDKIHMTIQCEKCAKCKNEIVKVIVYESEIRMKKYEPLFL